MNDKGYTVECRHCKARMEGLPNKKVALMIWRQHRQNCNADLFLECGTNVTIRNNKDELSMAGTGKVVIE